MFFPRRPAPGGSFERKVAGPPPLALKLAALLVVPIFLYGLYATGVKALDHYQLIQQSEDLQDQVQRLRRENLDLQVSLNEARTDTAVERIAREELGLIKPGDQPVALLSPAGQRATNLRATPTAPPDLPPLQQWWNLFFGR